MNDYFVCRSYPTSIIKRGRDRASSITQQEALSKRKNGNTSRIPLVMTFNRTSHQISNSIRENVRILLADEATRRIFGDDPILTAYRRDKSLRDHLVRSRLLNDDPNTPSGTTRCQRPRCNTCSHIVQGRSLEGPKRTWHVKGQFSCTTTNVIYGLTCERCGKLYIGETKRRLADRTTEHLRSIRLNTPGLPVAAHFNLPGHSSSDLKVCILKTCRGDGERKHLEERIIFTLGTLHPHGINVAFKSFPRPAT